MKIHANSFSRLITSQSNKLAKVREKFHEKNFNVAANLSEKSSHAQLITYVCLCVCVNSLFSGAEIHFHVVQTHLQNVRAFAMLLTL